MWSDWEYLLHFKLISCPNRNELLNDKPKETMRMGQVWGNALRCWIKQHIFWNVAKHPISFKDETETAQGIVQHWPKCVMEWMKTEKVEKWKMKESKLFLESDFCRSKQDSQEKETLSWKTWSCWSSACEAINACWHIAKKCSNPFRTETQEAIATCHKSAWLWLKAVTVMPVYMLGWELSPSNQFWGI